MCKSAVQVGPRKLGTWCAGITIIEMLISMTLAIVLMLALVMLYYGSAKTAAREENISSASRDARLINRRLARDFRLAGLIPAEDMDGDSNDINTDVPGQPWSDGTRDDFDSASTYGVVFTGDVDNDDHTETTSLFLIGDTLFQEQWEWSTVSRSWTGPVTRSLGTRVDHIILDYFDRDDRRIPDTCFSCYREGGFILSEGQRREITGVEITLVTRSDKEENRIPEELVLPDDTVFNDRFRRSVIQFMVRGRNLGLGA